MRKPSPLPLAVLTLLCVLSLSCTRGKKTDVVAKTTKPAVATGQNGLEGRPAPEFSLKDLDGGQVALADLRGKTVLLDFWATWCPPCRRAMPHIQKVHEEYQSLGLVVLGINYESPDKPRSFIGKHGYTFTTLSDPGRKVTDAYGVASIPTTVIIDGEGTVVKYTIGYKSETELRDALAEAGLAP